MRRSVNNGFSEVVREQLSFLRYEKVLIIFVYRRGRSGRNSRLRPGKETGGAGQGGAGRFAFQSSRAGYAVCRRAVHAANHVRFSRCRINGLAGGTEAGNGNPHRCGEENRRVHISGKWRRGGQSNCSYVEAT